MTHARACASQRRKRVIEIAPVRELKVHVLSKNDDHADAIIEDAICRAVEEDDRVPHRVDVLVARRALFQHDRAQTERD